MSLLVLAAAFFFAGAGAGAGPAVAREEGGVVGSFTVGTKEAPPFSMKTEDGGWEGISIDLWKTIALRLNLECDFREMTLQELFDGISDQSIDAAVAALTITPERERNVDFTHPFHTTGLGIAVSAKGENPWLAVVKKVFSLAFLRIVGALAALLLIVGFLIWLFERKHGLRHFSGGPLKGIGSGFWWSAVTMTTVGYGDKAPATPGGRLLAIVWMFAAIVMISGFTAAIASVLTVTQLASPVHGPEDLPGVAVGTVDGSTSAGYLRKNRIGFSGYGTVDEGLAALAAGGIVAFVYDAPLLRYRVNRQYLASLKVLRRTFLRQDYGIVLPEGSPMRESVNRILLEEIGGESWRETLYRYLGI